MTDVDVVVEHRPVRIDRPTVCPFVPPAYGAQRPVEGSAEVEDRG